MCCVLSLSQVKPLGVPVAVGAFDFTLSAPPYCHCGFMPPFLNHNSCTLPSLPTYTTCCVLSPSHAKAVGLLSATGAPSFWLIGLCVHFGAIQPPRI